MRKVLSLSLALVLILSMTPAAFAASGCANCGSLLTENCPVCETSYCAECKLGICDCNATVSSNGTQVEYNADDRDGDGQLDNLAYTITVPALLAPGGSGTVTLQGMWPSNATVKVTAEDKVEMVNNINSADKKELAVTFVSIEKAGSDIAIVTASSHVSVADISNALFGTWAGKFNYNVDYVSGSGATEPSDPDGGGATVEPGENQISFTIDGVTYLADKGLSWGQWLGSDYNTDGFVSNESFNISKDGQHFVSLDGTLVYSPEGFTSGAAYVTIIPMITFTIDGTEYQAEEGMTWREWIASDYNTDGYKDSLGVVQTSDGKEVAYPEEGAAGLITGHDIDKDCAYITK